MAAICVMCCSCSASGCWPLGGWIDRRCRRWAEKRIDDVVRQLSDAAYLFANVLARLGPDDWGRSVMYYYPEPAERSLRWVAVHTLHGVRHHLLDVRRQLA